MQARRGQSARDAEATRARRSRRGSQWGGPRAAALRPLIWAVLLVAVLYGLGQWARQAEPTGGAAPDAGAAAPDGRSGGDDPGAGAGAGTGAADPGAAQPGAGAAQPGTGAAQPGDGAAQPGDGAAQPGTGAAQPGTGDTGAAEPAGESEPGGVPAELAAARRHIDRTGGKQPTRVYLLYFVDLAAEGTLQPVEVLLPASKTPIRDVVTQWLHPPEDVALTTGVPAGTELAGGLRREGDTAIVDVTQTITRGGGTAWANGIIYTLVYSLTELDGIEKVHLKVNGRPAQLEGYVWDKPIGRGQLPVRDAFRIAPKVKFQP